MKIYYSLDKYFIIYNTNTNSYEEVFDSLENITHVAGKNDVLLLPEEYFIFTSAHYTFYSPSPFAISDLKNLIQKNTFIDKKSNNLIGQLIHHQLNNIVVNAIPEEFALWKAWQISFDIQSIYSHTHSELAVDYLQGKWVTLLPSSYATLQQANNQLLDATYHILYIQKNYSKLLTISHRFYLSTSIINCGSRTLKTMYEEQQIPKIYRDPSKVNPVTESIIKETSSFFAEQIINRVSSIAAKSQANTILVSELTKNYYVMDALKKQYSATVGGYIIPFAHSQSDQGGNIDIENYNKIRAWNTK
jgi:hypothetical protein